jgi:hypothetical protein
MDCISTLDASLILRQLVCTDNLDDCPFTDWQGNLIYPQRVAADVNCTGVITSMDASLILQYLVGMIDVFPCPDMWEFYALSNPSIPSCTGMMDLDWIGVLKGDVSGCYECPPKEQPLARATSTRIRIGYPRHYLDRVEFPVEVRGASDIYGVELDFGFDPDEFTVVSVRPTGLASGFSCQHHLVQNNISIAMAGIQGFSGSGRILKVTLAKTHEPMPNTAGKVWLSYARFNEGEPAAVIEGGTSGREIFRMALGPIVPNPFTDGTTVNYSLAEDLQVRIRVYSVSGQLVTTLYEGQADAGPHSLAWDGTDRSGKTVARGVYFCRMEAGDFTSTRKLIHLK